MAGGTITVIGGIVGQTGDPVVLAVNSSGQLVTSLQTGDNAALNAKRVAGLWSFSNITTATTTTVKSGAGMLGKIIVNKAVATGTITLYDNTAASGTKIGTITFGAALLSDPPLTGHYEVQFSTGLTIVTVGASDLTVCYV